MTDAAPAPTRRRRLQEATRDVHADLDGAMMRADPFADVGRYGRFLLMQHRLHAAAAPLYADPALAALVPDLADRPRRDLFARDLADLQLDAPPPEAAPAALDGATPAFRLGWLYVVEGSTLGAAFLAKAAAGLGYDETHGARGLGAPAGGRGAAWQRFVAALDAAQIAAAEEEEVDAGARAAFAHAHALADRMHGG